MNKKIYNEDLVLNLIVNGDKITPGNKKLLTELNELDQAMRKLQLANAKLELDRRNLSKSDANYAEKLKLIENQMKANDKQMDSYRARMMELRKEIGVAGMTINQLNTYLKVLQTQLRNATDPTVVKGLRKEIEQVQTRITTLTTGAGRLSQAWAQLARDANKYSAAIGWISVIVYGISNAVGNLIDRLTGLDRKLSEVMKTTGLTREEAARLKREFDLAPTPTKTDDLLAMAKIAGRLGIEGFENIRKFTGAVDVLYTALGDDLNLSVEDTAEKVGKLVNAFRVTDKMPIDEALLRTGSLLNQLDKSSVASAGTILEYMTRLSSLGTTANYPMEQLAGLAAALETVNIPAERGSTALRNIIDGLGKHAEKFSRILGMSMDEYKRAIETDVNGVFLKLIELTSKGDKSILDTVQSMGDFEISGVRVAEVFGALAKNLDVVRTQQAIATESFKSSASVMSEYNIIINDFKGSVEGQQKRVRALADEFNLSLRPAAFSAYKMWVDFLYILRDMSRWMYEHSNLMKGLVSLYIALKATALSKFIIGLKDDVHYFYLVLKDNYKAMVTHNSILIAWREGGIKGAIVALRALWATMLANPMTSIITILGAIAGAFFLFKGKIDLVTEAMANMMEDMNKQRSEMAKLFDIVEQTSVGTDRHNAAIKALNEVYGKYLPNLLTEKDGIDAVTTARRAAIKALEDEILLKHENDSFAKIQEDYAAKRIKEAELLLDKLSPTMRGQAARGLEDMYSTINSQQYSTKRTDPQELGRKWLEQFGLVTSSDDNTMAKSMDNYLELIQKQMDAMSQFNAFKRGYQSTTVSSLPTKPSDGIDTGTPAMSEEEFKKQQQTLEVAYKEQLISLRNSIADKDKLRKAELQAESGYTDRLIGLQLNYNKEDKAALTDLKLKKSELQQQMEELGIKHNTIVEQAENQHYVDLANIKHRFLSGEIKTEQEYDNEILKTELTFLAEKRDAYEKGSKEWLDLDNQILEKQVQAQNKVHDKLLEAQRIFSRIKTDSIVDEVEKSKKLEDDRWEEEKALYESKLIKKENLSAEEIQLNDTLYAIIEAKAKEHQEKMRKIEAVGNEPMLNGLENALKGVSEVDKNTTYYNNDDLQKQFTERNDLIREQYVLEKSMAGNNAKEIQKAENKYDQLLLKSKEDLFNAEKKMNEAKIQMAQAYISALIQIVGQESDLGKALYVFSQGLAIADVWIKAAAANAAITSEALALYAWAGPAAPGLAAAWAAAPIAANNTSAALNTGLIAAQTVGTIVTQWEKGKYPGSTSSPTVPVIGADDGQTYWASWTGNAQTGIYTQPSLVAEKGPEMVIDYPTLRNIKMNNPRLIETVMAYRVPQYANGMYDQDFRRLNHTAKDDTSMTDIGSSLSPEDVRSLISAITRLNDHLDAGIRANINKYGTNGIEEALKDIADFNAKVFK